MQTSNSKSFTFSVVLTSENVYTYLELEKVVQDHDFKDCCIQFLLGDVGTCNCLKNFLFAKLHNLKQVYEKALLMLKTNFDDITRSNEFKELRFNDLAEVLTIKDGQVPPEESVFCAMIGWIKHDVSTRGVHVAELFKMIKVEKLSKQFLSNVVTKEPLIMDSCECVNKLVQFEFPFAAAHAGSSRSSRNEGPVTGFLAFGGTYVWMYNSSNKELRKIPETKFNHNGGSAVKLGNHAYVVGGRNHSVERLNLSYTNQGWVVVGNTIDYRLWSASVSCDGHILTFGGGNPITSSGEEYDYQSNVWKRIFHNMNHKRGFHGLVECGGFLYAIGGVDEKGNNLSSAERLDLQSKCWMRIPSMKKTKGKVVAVALNDQLYVAKTVKDQDSHASIEKYDPKSGRWYEVSSLSRSHHNFGACVTNEKIYVAGGGSTAIEVYDHDKDKWSVEAEFEVLKHIEFIIAI